MRGRKSSVQIRMFRNQKRDLEDQTNLRAMRCDIVVIIRCANSR